MENHQNISTEEYLQAKKAVEEKMGFYVHLAVFLAVNGFFVYSNLKSGGYFWATWPLLGWGIGLLFHGIGAFGFFNSSAWKQKQIQKELDKMRKNNFD